MTEYMRRLLRAKNDLPVSGVYDVTLLHDEWCASHFGSPCNCQPEMLVRVEGQTWEVMRDGSSRKVS